MDWDEMLARLKQERDELELKLHLGKKEAAAEWERLEAKWQELRATKGPPLKEAARETAEGVGEELRKGYERFRKLLS
jgi:hypothetical protein